MRLRGWVAIFVLFWSAPTWVGTAWSGPETLPHGGEARVVAVVDGDTIVLNDRRQVRLVGIQAPKLPLGRTGFEPWPLSDEAKTHMSRLCQGKAVHLRLPARPQDRHGRVLAHVVADDGAWLQGEMLKAGLARVYTFSDNRDLADELLALERQARAERRGIWALPYYAPRTPENVAGDIGTFQIVEGWVQDAARVKKRIYLNFGADWRKDFTIAVEARHDQAFLDAGIDLLRLRDQRVRVRGWVKSKNGPMIEVDHPERLEILQTP